MTDDADTPPLAHPNQTGDMVKDETGKVYGRLTVIRRSWDGAGARKGALWLCRCTCGEEPVVRGSQLRNGTTVSCGCASREALARGGKIATSRQRWAWLRFQDGRGPAPRLPGKRTR